MAGNIITLRMTKAQARAIVAIIEMDMASGYDDMAQVFGARDCRAAENGAKRITAALVKASREDRLEAAA